MPDKTAEAIGPEGRMLTVTGKIREVEMRNSSIDLLGPKESDKTFGVE